MENRNYISDAKRLKIFNKILKEFLNQCNTIKKGETRTMFKADSISFLKTFRQECDFLFESFINCDDCVVGSISLCKKADLDKLISELSTENSKSLWGYIHNLYIVCVNGDKNVNLEEIVNKSKEGISLINKDFIKNVGDDTSPFGNDLGGIIEEISNHVNSQLVDNSTDGEIDPMELMTRLMSGEENVIMGGVDFSKILKSTTESIQNKINSGDLDINVLKNQTMGLLNSVPGVSEKLNDVLGSQETVD